MTVGDVKVESSSDDIYDEGVAQKGVIQLRQRTARQLQRNLGPEFISNRVGPGNLNIPYLTSHHAVSLVNAMFGYDGWSNEVVKSEIVQEEKEPSPHGKGGHRYSIQVLALVKIVLSQQHGGVSRQDYGLGEAQHLPSRGAAFEKALKQATTDGFKRASRLFGNATGNCIYNKGYREAVGRIKKPFIKINEEDLYHLPDYKSGGKRRRIEHGDRELVCVVPGSEKETTSSSEEMVADLDGYDDDESFPWPLSQG
jgi:DNA repair and recombination protein RAD52